MPTVSRRDVPFGPASIDEYGNFDGTATQADLPPPSRRQPERAAPKFLAFDTFPLPLYRERAAVA
ncbi:hypothetical protein [Mesorhizobium sp. M0643]|uniref:hypothetical protein n=1 Tax=Mesorhizobium sp. M0643 TaxID=2956978 RepID=UPI003335F43E